MGSQPASSSELQRLWRAAQDELTSYIEALVATAPAVLASPSAASAGAWARAREALTVRLGELLALGDLLGRRRLLLELRAAQSLGAFDRLPWVADEDLERGYAGALPPVQFADPATSVPRVSFKDALRDLTSRTPQLAENASTVAEIYQRHGFSAARAVDETVLARVQAEIGEVISIGAREKSAVEIVAQLADWTQAYAQTVVRTNLTTAYAAGRFAQLADPAVKRLVPALRFVSVREPWNPKTHQGTRPNHAACHGLIAAVDDPVWNEIAPPLGFNCRCTVALVTRGMVASQGLLLPNGEVRRAKKPPGGGPDPGFRHAGRPDLGIYGGVS